MSDSDATTGRREAVVRYLEAFPWGEGVLAGVATFVVGYGVFFLLLIATGAVDFGRSVAAILRSVAFFFYNAHNVPTFTQQRRFVRENETVVGEILQQRWENGITGWVKIHQEVISDGQVVQDATQTLVQGTDPALPPTVYLLVPILVLLVAAAVFTRRRVDTSAVESPVDALIVGLAVAASMTLGYLVVVLLGTYGFAVQGGDTAFVRPARLEALAFGLLYPFACAAVSAGVVIGIERGERLQADESSTDDEDT